MSMKKLALSLAVIAATCAGAATGHAGNNRTFVSNAGVSGNTALGCSTGSPCDTFAHALSVTNSGGEIDCLNAGDFGPVTVSISVTINCQSVSNGGITAGSGATAITITTTGVVNLIGLDIDGENSGLYGVFINAAATVNIRNCKVYGFSGTGIASLPSSSGATLIVDNAFVANNGNGIFESEINGVANMTVRNSNINHNDIGIAVIGSGSTHSGATIEQTTLAFNGTGLQANTSGAVALIGGSTVVNNNNGVTTQDGGTVYSFNNNQIGGNDTDGTPLTAYPGGPLN